MSFHVAVYKTPNQGLENENSERFKNKLKLLYKERSMSLHCYNYADCCIFKYFLQSSVWKEIGMGNFSIVRTSVTVVQENLRYRSLEHTETTPVLTDLIKK
jgi:hypothetical protein